MLSPIEQDSWPKTCCRHLVVRILLRYYPPWSILPPVSRVPREIRSVRLRRVHSFHLCLSLSTCIVGSSIVRISPNHVHINDTDFYHEYVDKFAFLFCIVSIRKELKSRRVFSPRSEFYKAPELYDNVGLPGSLITMTDPHKHKIRRNVLNPLFSARSIDSISSRTTRTVERALETIVDDTQAGKAINIELLFRRIMVSTSCSFSFLKRSE